MKKKRKTCTTQEDIGPRAVNPKAQITVDASSVYELTTCNNSS